MKTVLRVLGLLILVLIAAIAIRTLTFRSRQIPPAPGAPPPVAVDGSIVAEHLGRAVQFQTVTNPEPGAAAAAPFLALHAYLAEAFPRTHATLEREVVAERSLLYTWKGSDPSLAPVVLMGHMDVVPVEASTVGQWSEPPFAGHVRDGFVWGRGTLDDKVAVLTILESIELLLKDGARPRRTIYLAFSHDEELLGSAAPVLAERVRAKANGLAPLLVLDEGMAITSGLVPGVAGPVGLIGTAQKGYLTLELTARETGGHSSQPPPHTAVGLVALAVARLESQPMPASLHGAADDLFDFAGPEMALPLRLAIANRWLLAPLIKRLLLAGPSTAAMLRTTTAATMIHGGVRDNVLPQSAQATINFRIRPGDTVASVQEHVRRVVGDHIEVKVLGTPTEPSHPSSSSSQSFQVIARSLRELEPGTVVAPALMLGYADARVYEPMTPDVYRFLPVRLTGRDLERLHGTDERVAIEDLVRCVRFFAQLLRNTAL